MAEAVVFDMNGVIIDDERFHQESWKILAQKHGLHITEEEFTHKIFGRREIDTLQFMFGSVPSDELEEYFTERVSIVKKLFGPHFAPTPGAVEFIRSLHESGMPLAIATSSRTDYASFILDGLDIRKYFTSVVTAEDVTKGKPHPEIYLTAAEELGVPPALCVAIEDSRSGIRSAKEAGMQVIGITTTHKREELEGADVFIRDFRGIAVKDIEHFREFRSSRIENK